MSKINNLNQAIEILISGVEIGQKSGVYTLKDASLINDAIQLIKTLSGVKETEQEPMVDQRDEAVQNDGQVENGR